MWTRPLRRIHGCIVAHPTRDCIIMRRILTVTECRCPEIVAEAHHLASGNIGDPLVTAFYCCATTAMSTDCLEILFMKCWL